MPVKMPHLYNGYTVKVLGLLAIIGFAASVWFILSGRDNPTPTYKLLCQIIGALWVLGPPLWFFYEHFYYFPKHGNSDADFAQLKSSQDIAAKVWAAFLVVLAALFTGTFPK